jgi:hypothetical protein
MLMITFPFTRTVWGTLKLQMQVTIAHAFAGAMQPIHSTFVRLVQFYLLYESQYILPYAGNLDEVSPCLGMFKFHY